MARNFPHLSSLLDIGTEHAGCFFREVMNVKFVKAKQAILQTNLPDQLSRDFTVCMPDASRSGLR